MLRKKVFKSLIIFSLVLVTLFSVSGIATLSKRENKTVIAQTNGNTESSLFDGVLKLVAEKGANMVKDNLPTVGDFLCSIVFDYIGIDYTDKQTTELKEIHNTLKQIQKDLRDIAEKQTQEKSRIVIRDFLNSADVFSVTIQPLYSAFNFLMRQEKDGALSPEESSEREQSFYNNNLKTLMFGSGTSTGSLYLQLNTLLNKIVKPDVTIVEKNLMEHYTVTYKYLWPFETLSFKPKKEFLGYVSTVALEGLILYAFQNLYESSVADSATKVRLETEWSIINQASQLAFEYLKQEIEAVNNTEKKSVDGNYVFHYSSGKTFSKKLYLGNAKPTNESDHFTYRSYYNINRQGNVRSLRIKTLDARNVVNNVENEYKAYKSNYKKAESYSLSDFLSDAGFTCENWSNEGLYKGQRFRHDGSTFSTEWYRFYIEYTSQAGNGENSNWGDVKYKVWGSPEIRKMGSKLQVNGICRH